MTADLPPGFRDQRECGVVQIEQGAADGGVRSGRAEQSSLVQAELLGLDQVRRAEHDGHRELDHHDPPIAPDVPDAHRQHISQGPGQPHPVGAPTQQYRSGMPDQPFAVGPYTQPTIPPCTLAHRKGALTLATDTA